MLRDVAPIRINERPSSVRENERMENSEQSEKGRRDDTTDGSCDGDGDEDEEGKRRREDTVVGRVHARLRSGHVSAQRNLFETASQTRTANGGSLSAILRFCDKISFPQHAKVWRESG